MKKAVLPACLSSENNSLSFLPLHTQSSFVCVAYSGAGGSPRGATPLQPLVQPLQVTTILITTGKNPKTTQKDFANTDRFPGSFGMGLESGAVMMVHPKYRGVKTLGLETA